MPAGDEDWFELQTPATGTLLVTASGPGGTADMNLEIRDATGQQVLAESGVLQDALGNTIGQQAIVASASGESYQVRVTAAQPDTSWHVLTQCRTHYEKNRRLQFAEIVVAFVLAARMAPRCPPPV